MFYRVMMAYDNLESINASSRTEQALTQKAARLKGYKRKCLSIILGAIIFQGSHALVWHYVSPGMKNNPQVPGASTKLH